MNGNIRRMFSFTMLNNTPCDVELSYLTQKKYLVYLIRFHNLFNFSRCADVFCVHSISFSHFVLSISLELRVFALINPEVHLIKCSANGKVVVML